MNLIVILAILSLFIPGVVADPSSNSQSVHSFKAGEHLKFKLGYGWFTLGEATLNISSGDLAYTNEDCYKVELVGETTGVVGLWNVHDEWGAYVEKDHLRPLVSYQNIQEGRYTRNEKTFYDYERGELKIFRYDKRKEPKSFAISHDVHDIMSAYLKVRNLNLNNFKKGDTVSVNMFYDHLFYNVVILYEGIEEVKTHMGKLNAHKIYFLVPENDVFPKKGGIVGWISADKNQLPLRVEAEMFVGSVFCDLVSYKNIKYGPDFTE